MQGYDKSRPKMRGWREMSGEREQQQIARSASMESRKAWPWSSTRRWESESCVKHVNRKPFSATLWSRRCAVLLCVCVMSDESVRPAQMVRDVVRWLSDCSGVHHHHVSASATCVALPSLQPKCQSKTRSYCWLSLASAGSIERMNMFRFTSRIAAWSFMMLSPILRELCCEKRASCRVITQTSMCPRYGSRMHHRLAALVFIVLFAQG